MNPYISNTNIKKLQTIQNTALPLLLAAHETQILKTFNKHPTQFKH